MQIKVPLFVNLKRKAKDKKIWLNMNVYRNLHYIVENQAKNEFYKQIKASLPDTKFKSLNSTFQIFKCKSKQGVIKKLDKSNVYAVLSKYFFDSLTLNGNILDDNDTVIKTETILPTKYLDYGEVEYAVFEILPLDN